MRSVNEDGDLEKLVERCRRNDPQAWSSLVDRFQALVYSVPRRYGLTDDDAADVFQTTFSSLLRSLDRLESGFALPKWLAVTAARESLRLRRLNGRTMSYDSPGMSLDEMVAQDEGAADLAAVEADRAFRVRKGLADLAARCRELLSLLYLGDDVPYAEISHRLGMPVGAIGPTRARCLEKLRGVLARQGFFE